MHKRTPYDFLVVSLKGISQVILIENAIVGLIILVTITIANCPLGILALISSIIGTWIGAAGGSDQTMVDKGLYGYNSVLTGLALALFLDGSQEWAIALAGAAIAALSTAAAIYTLRSSGLPILTLPYILLTWFLLLASFHLGAFQLTPELVPQDLAHLKHPIGGTINLVEGLFGGIGQVYFQNRVWAGLLILIAVVYYNWRLGLLAIIGTVVAWLTACGLGAEVPLLNLGLYGYNAVLTILAVSADFHKIDGRLLLRGIIAGLITVPITAGMSTWLNPYGLPVLTMPFVLTTWIFFAAKKVLPKL